MAALTSNEPAGGITASFNDAKKIIDYMIEKRVAQFKMGPLEIQLDPSSFNMTPASGREIDEVTAKQKRGKTEPIKIVDPFFDKDDVDEDLIYHSAD